MLITDGKNEKNVTKGAYEQFYKPLGYKPIVVIQYEESKNDFVEKQTNEIEKKEKTVLKTNTPKRNKK